MVQARADEGPTVSRLLNADEALALASRMLATEEAAGTVVFLTDGIDRSYADVFAEAARVSGDQQIFLAFGLAEDEVEEDRAAPDVPADIAGLEAVAAGSGAVYRAAPDTSDVGRLMSQVRSRGHWPRPGRCIRPPRCWCGRAMTTISRCCSARVRTR